MVHPGFAALLALVLVLSVLPGVAAAETRTGGSVVIGPGEVIDDDLEAYGGTVVVHGTVNGDLEAFAGNVLIAGTVTGDVEGAAGNVQVTGTIGGNLEASAGNVEIADGAEIRGDLAAAAGNVIINGVVDGSVEAAAESVTLGPTARIGGDLAYDGSLDRAESATVGGEVRREDDLAVGAPFGGAALAAIPSWIGGVYGFFANLLLGAVLLLVFPRFSGRVVEAGLGAPLKAGGVGLLTLIAVPVALLMIALTIIGIPLSLLGVLLFIGLLWTGGVYGRILVGSWLLSLANRERRWLALLVGLVAVGLVGLIPVIGGLVDVLVLLLGLGALALALVRTYRGRSPAEVEPSAESDAESGPAAT